MFSTNTHSPSDVGWDGPVKNEFVNIELGNSKQYQLYDLKNDIGQKNNLAGKDKKKLEEMIFSFLSIRGEGYEVIEKLELK